MSVSLRSRFIETTLSYLDQPATPFFGRRVPVGPEGDMSCSGFICWIADELELSRPISKYTGMPVRTSREMFYYWGHPINNTEAREGDLVFFSKRGTNISHVGVYLGDGMYIHSPGISNGKVEITRIDEFKPRVFKSSKYYGERTGKEYDIVFTQNPVGFNRIL